ncbi:hypothetical protein Q3O98_12075 [Ralstonia pseudosolanacearum]|uniref:hypothetical protein n=1 Tax=Ralstonia pseudosolanacearum TaxID=1310165 RepID=UPI0026768AE9|nr:hypothetical protein [Ralstonia pseudosolanacearum]MDO3621838.1 hypothetical protein [Ralstonia pseudosolanacearum]
MNIEVIQARKNLSVSPRGRVPDVWNEARKLGPEAIDALVLIAIIFSHAHLIDTVKNAKSKKDFCGTILRGEMQNGKAFTNFAHTIEELGYSVEHSTDHIRYDLEKLFKIPGLAGLAAEIIRLKLITAGWDQRNSLPDESTRLGFHEVFSLSATDFSRWLNGGFSGPVTNEPWKPDDAEFFFSAGDTSKPGKFRFRSGHREKKTGQITHELSPESRSAILLHNAIQTRLYKELCDEYGADCVGTEVPTGDGTSVDVVVKTKDFCWFYEIKTDVSVKGCIRQAIPQLLEYAYWQCDKSRADKLIIVSPNSITPEAQQYLAFLRKTFGLPLSYRQGKP